MIGIICLDENNNSISDKKIFTNLTKNISFNSTIHIKDPEKLYKYQILLNFIYIYKKINKNDNVYIINTNLPISNNFVFLGYSETTKINNEEYKILMYKKQNKEQNKDEENYLSLAHDIINNGFSKSDRTKIGTLSKFGQHLEFDLSNSTLPLLTTKKMFVKGVIHELLWILNGETNSKLLEKNNVNIWKGNTSQEFIDTANLPYSEGDTGPLYGFQLRHFGAEYKDCNEDYTGKGIDQLLRVINQLKNDKDSRRILFSYWNPIDLDKMVLNPCHVLFQFYVENNNLMGHLYQRSADMFLGVPFNITFYCVLLHLIALRCNLNATKLFISFGDCHVYKNHIEQFNKQMQRVPRCFPKLIINQEVKNKNINEIKLNDFQVIGYYPYDSIKAPMAI